MIRGTVIIEGSPKGMVRQFRQFVKEGLKNLISNYWHPEILPQHFEPKAKRRYKYAPRDLKYTRSKTKRKPMAGPLEFSGKAKRMLTRTIRVTGTAKKATGTMQAPRYFWMTPKDHPDKPAEVTAVTKGETLTMAKILNSRVTKRLNTLKDRKIYK